MTTVVSIFLEKRENVLTVPRAAVHREKGEKFVYVLTDNQSEYRQVKIGWSDDEYSEIREGLDENELVILGDVRSRL
jgi:HlyD family secretion protein/macrolide-specific efflux system membrane fusion protein